MGEDNHNTALLPMALKSSLLKFHLLRVCSGLLVLIIGAVSIGVYEKFLYIPVLTAGLVSLFAGVFGVLATMFRSVALHAGCLGTSILSLWVGRMAYILCLEIVATYPTTNKDAGLVTSDLLLVTMDLVTTTVVVGLQAAVLWVSQKEQRQYFPQRPHAGYPSNL
ncbi:hypothetical protein Hamer_G007459 [Homarus americanus]|uniref:Uncharacterized protein n=1 Tax=Homarus americanus TaxID=6706 RepID=A0A8J5JNT5_HOMAM|nr:hypothetical protein Hamer_G007459 [Homarus americanus]